MSYSDDVLLTVAKELFISKVVPNHPDRSPQNADQYKTILEDVTDNFSCFVRQLREKLRSDVPS